MAISDYRPVEFLKNIKYIRGLELSNNATTPNSIIDVAAGNCMDSTNTFQMVAANALTASTATSGAGGLDTGTVAASTIYYVHLITDLQGANPPSLVLSTSATAPLLPFGFALFRNIGAIRTDGSSNILKGLWSGSAENRLFMYDAPLATTITAGAATTVAEVPLSGLVPAIYLNMPVIMYTVATGDAASRTLSVRPYGNTGYPIVITTQVTSVAVTSTYRVQSRLNTTPSLQYVWNAGTNTAAFSVAGYEYYLG